jgi:hypothetical protein
MKKLIALFAIVVLTTSFAFAQAVDPGSRGDKQEAFGVTNPAHVYIWCNHMIFTCTGPVDLNIVAGTESSAVETDWKIENWGDAGKFEADTAGCMEITPPSHGAASDLIVNNYSGSGYTNGWTWTNVAPYSGHANQYQLSTYACNSVGHMTYKFTVKAKDIAVHGQYDIFFTVTFTEL